MKKLVLFIFLIVAASDINAQSSKRLALNLGYGSHGPIIGLYYTQPISNKIAISLLTAYSFPNKLTGSDLDDVNAPIDEIRELNSSTELNVIKLDLSYRISPTQPLNLYMGYGMDLYDNRSYFTPIGMSYAKRNFVFYTEVSNYWIYYSYNYSYQTSVTNGSTYFYTGNDNGFNSFTGLNYGIRYYFK